MHEPHYATGEVKITRNALVLLQALLDHPHMTVPSVNAWMRSADALASAHGMQIATSVLRKSQRRINPLWVTRQRFGRHVVVRLTPRGAAIVNREVEARVIGRGAYTSLRALADLPADTTPLRDDLEVLERFRAQLITNWEKSKEHVPGWAAVFREVALEVERTLNAMSAASCGLIEPDEIRTAAVRAIAALDAFEARGARPNASRRRRYLQEYRALARLAGLVVRR